MLYLDDLAVWVKTRRGKLVQTILCGIFLAIAVIVVIAKVSTINNDKETIRLNDIEISSLNGELSGITNKIDNYKSTDVTNTFTPSNIGDIVAEEQTKYGNFDSYTNIETIGTAVDEIKDTLSDYIEAGNLVDNWYDYKSGKYVWSFICRQAYVVNDVDYVEGIFVCKNGHGNSETLAVATCKINVETNKIYDLEVMNTHAGNEFKTTEVISSIGSIYEPMTNEDFYRTYIRGDADTDITDVDSNVSNNVDDIVNGTSNNDTNNNSASDGNASQGTSVGSDDDGEDGSSTGSSANDDSTSNNSTNGSSQTVISTKKKGGSN